MGKLERLSPLDQLAILEAVDKKRHAEHFLKYWEAQPQQSAHFPQFTRDVKVFGVLGGNRSGKTEEGAFICLAWALGKEYFRGEPTWEYVKDLPIPNGPVNIWIVGLDFPTLRDVIWREKLRHGRQHPGLLPKDPAIVVKDGDFQIFFPNGSIVTGKSADAGREKFQGASVDLIWIDEEPDVEVYNECWQRTVDCGGRILLTLTPLTDVTSGAREPWVFDLFEEAQKGRHDVKFVQLNVLENPYVPAEEKTKLLEKWAGHPEEKARLYGEFFHRSGLVYPMWSPKLHLIKPYRIPPHYTRIVSIDPAATGVTAAVWAAIEPTTNTIILYREYYERDQIASEHAKNILLQNSGDLVDIWMLDSKWGAQRNAETHKQNIQLFREVIPGMRLAPVDDDFGLNVSREYLNATINPTARHAKVYVFDTLHNFRWELEHYTWDRYQRGDLRGLSKDKPRKRNDHLMNAFQYLCGLRPKCRATSQLSASDKQELARTNSYT